MYYFWLSGCGTQSVWIQAGHYGRLSTCSDRVFSEPITLGLLSHVRQKAEGRSSPRRSGIIRLYHWHVSDFSCIAKCLLLPLSTPDLIIQIKPKLSGNKGNNATLITELHRLANLAESFTEQRPRSNNGWLTLADDLDREGVNLWNTSGILRQGKDQEDLKLFAALRLAAFRLIEAGLEQKPGIETLLHVLQLASKTGSALSDIQSHDMAGTVLGAAAKIEELLCNGDIPEAMYAQSKSRALIVYYTCRMEAAWKEGNEGVAQFMLRKITGTAPILREQLASKILEIGKAIAREGSAAGKHKSGVIRDEKRAQDAVKWIQKSLALIENLVIGETTGILELKASFLLCYGVNSTDCNILARVYYLASATDDENLNKAEATLHELITSIDDTCDRKSSEFQQVRWMRLAVLKRRHATDNSMLEAFQSIIEHSSLTETEVSDILQELRGMAQHHALVMQVNEHLLEASLASESSGRPFIDKILFASIFHCSRDSDHERAISAVRKICSRIADRDDYELQKVPTTACQSLLWQFGNRHYNAKAWYKAADWFLLGTHDAFKSMAKTNYSRCLRKAALCYIQQQEYALATTVIRRCRNNEAATHYVVLLIAMHQGEAITHVLLDTIHAVEDMVQAKDFDKRMLLLATQLAHDANLKTLLLTILDSLLSFLKCQGGFENEIEALTMVRCIIRLVIELIKQPAAELLAQPWVNMRGHTAQAICESTLVKKELPIIVKELSWLWRTAYNIAVQGCSDWDGEFEEQFADLFDLSRAFMESYQKASVTDSDPAVHGHMILAIFCSISCRTFAIRRLKESLDQTDARNRICRDIQTFKGVVHSARNRGQMQNAAEEDRIKSFIHVALVFETEQRCALNDWGGLLTSIEEASASSQVKAGTFEAMADILWVEKTCPVNVLYAALEAILHACLDLNYISVEKFSRWLRAICTILLAKNTVTDRAKAVGYIEQAVSVLEDNCQEGSENASFQCHIIYPMDERQWLLSTSYNTGVECLAASHLDEAKRWFESATMISRYVPEGKERAERVRID
ncbi:hypothetical protein BU17DRAFT_42114 [Hysterangium stoloniferum]|nr:hypothetical protein BU17DRAFT_42114 [Hysterangium stoloniferum]